MATVQATAIVVDIGLATVPVTVKATDPDIREVTLAAMEGVAMDQDIQAVMEEVATEAAAMVDTGKVTLVVTTTVVITEGTPVDMEEMGTDQDTPVDMEETAMVQDTRVDMEEAVMDQVTSQHTQEVVLTRETLEDMEETVIAANNLQVTLAVATVETIINSTSSNISHREYQSSKTDQIADRKNA